jgi:DNA-binding CsgD family transcriptional regulator
MIVVEKIGEKRSMDFEKARTEYNLTKRELELVKLICKGRTNKKISQKLFISKYTVKDHIKNIMRKMNASSRNEIVAILVR